MIVDYGIATLITVCLLVFVLFPRTRTVHGKTTYPDQGPYRSTSIIEEKPVEKKIPKAKKERKPMTLNQKRMLGVMSFGLFNSATCITLGFFWPHMSDAMDGGGMAAVLILFCTSLVAMLFSGIFD